MDYVCEHWFSRSCAVAGRLAGTDYVPVDDDVCRWCSGSALPRQPNSATAGAALRWLRRYAPDRINARRRLILPYLECVLGRVL